jgi:hypothetical protein
MFGYTISIYYRLIVLLKMSGKGKGFDPKVTLVQLTGLNLKQNDLQRADRLYKY